MPDPTPDVQAEYRGEALAVRAVLGGALMGLANLVPGISGGTMLLAAGVYPHFINGVAEVSTFRLRARTVLTLGCIVGAAFLAIIGFAGPVSRLVVDHRWGLVVDHRWVMYSLFIGLTLGGVPILWRMLRPVDPPVVVAAIAGIAVMALMVWIGPGDIAGTEDGSRPYAMYFLAGLAGASAMVLPGVSGGYLLLVLGQYVAVLSAVAALKDGVRAGDWDAVGETMHVVVPVGLGVVVGVVGVSNLIKLLLARFERATLGVLLGLLLGAVIGLWPFQAGVAPAPGSAFRGDRVVEADSRLVMERTGREIEAGDHPTAFFRPDVGQVGGAVGLVILGFAVSFGISHLGGGENGRKD
jgi:putative membrane protein